MSSVPTQAGATETSTAAEFLPAAALFVPSSSTSAAAAEPGTNALTEAEPPPLAATPRAPFGFTLAAGLASHSPFKAGAARADGLKGRWALGVPVQIGAEWSRVQAALGLTFGSHPFDPEGPGGRYQTSPELRVELLGRYLFELAEELTPFVGLKVGWRRTSLVYRSDDAFEGCTSFRFGGEETVCFGLEGLELERTMDGFSAGPLVGFKQVLGRGNGVSWSLLAEGWLEGTHWDEKPRARGPWTEEVLELLARLEDRPDAPAFDLGLRLMLEARLGEASGPRASGSGIAMLAAIGAQALVPIGSGDQGSRTSLVAPLMLGLQVGERLEVALELGLGSGAFDLAPFGESAAGGIEATTALEQHLLLLGRYTLYDGAQFRPYVGVRGGLRRDRHELSNDRFLEVCADTSASGNSQVCGPVVGAKIRYDLSGLQLGPVVGLRQVLLQDGPYGLHLLAEAFGNFTLWRVDTDWLGGVGSETRPAYRALVAFEPDQPTFELGGRVLIEGTVGLW